MESKARKLTIVVAVTTAIAGAWLIPGSCEAVSGATASEPGPGEQWLHLREDVWLPVVDDVGRDLIDARRGFLEGDRAEAAAEARKAAALMIDAQSHAAQSDQVAFAAAIDSLEDLASKLEHGQVASLEELDPVLEKAYQTDIVHHWVAISERYYAWVPLVPFPYDHLYKAHEEFADRDRKAAATDVHQAAAFLKLEEKRATNTGRAALDASARELDDLANRIDENGVSSVSELDAAFARAEHALAEHHYRKALGDWAKDDAVSAGHALDAAVTDLEHALTWSRRKAETSTVAAIDEARPLARKLIGDTDWARDEVDRVIRDVGNGIERFGKATAPKENASSEARG
jgi:hypothetical protein